MPEVYLGCAIGTARCSSFLLWLETTEVVPSLLQKLKWLHHLSGLWSPLLCCKKTDNCHRSNVAWLQSPTCAEEIQLLDILTLVVWFSTLSKAHSRSILTIAVVRESCSNCKLIWALSLAILDSIDTYIWHLALSVPHCSSNTTLREALCIYLSRHC